MIPPSAGSVHALNRAEAAFLLYLPMLTAISLPGKTQIDTGRVVTAHGA